MCTRPHLIEVTEFDITQPNSDAKLDELCKKATLVISLLPYLYHVQAAKVALANNKPFCTTSYVSDEMKGLDGEAKKRGLILLNECGVDPGLDHMSAKKIIDEAHAQGGKILQFYSICGGLPAPKFNDNPYGYKFSWAPRGVLLASRNSGQYMRDGEVIKFPGEKLFAPENVFPETIDELDGKQFEWYFNRDSVKYADIYSIPEVKTIIRGTYRYPGWCRVMKAIADVGLTKTEPESVGFSFKGMTYKQAASKMLDCGPNESPEDAICRRLNITKDDLIIKNLEWVGLFSDEMVPDVGTRIDALCHIFKKRLVYKEFEEDMIIMKHTFDIGYEDGHRETKTSVLLDIGLQSIGGDSSMARTVSLPLAVACDAVLHKKIQLTGLQLPVVPELYNHILSRMEKAENVKFIDKTLPPLIHVRTEVKPGEQRVAVTPVQVKSLLGAGYRVVVEKSDTRCFRDNEYAAAGATLVAPGSWTRASHV